ncbi:dual specificity protein phosphatase [Plakobranchus ocellatus]|uniref:Dual specificity protein phosphatase n=1 Tax=Plakobranchus ocellatus TaxID=259542 RepID=A0AAV4DPW0_9GAST|nr:dual specificity protein phosphatase [Plakobranchus ocellatus]
MVVMENVCGVEVSEVTDVLSTDSLGDFLIIDCRSFLAFNQSRIVDSINVHCPPILKRRSGGFIALENIVPCENKRNRLLQGIYDTVFVYDENTHDLIKAPSDSNILSVITSLLKQVEKLSVRFIKGGFEAVREECPILCMDLRFSHPMRDKSPHKDRGKQSRMKHTSAHTNLSQVGYNFRSLYPAYFPIFLL